MNASLQKLALGLTLSLLSNLAAAQWQWKDENGRMVYSDRPPPGSVNPGQMVKAPAPKVVAKVDPKDAKAEGKDGKPLGPVAAAAAALKGGNLPAAQSVAAKSPADKEMESKKKALETEQADKKRAADTEREAKNTAACEDTKASLRTLESGVRVSQTNAKGEREFLSDEGRTKRTADLKRDIAEHCGKAKG